MLRQQDGGADVTSESLYAAYYYDKTSNGIYVEDGMGLPALGNLERTTDADSGRGSGQLTEGWTNKDTWQRDDALKVIDRPSQPG